MVAVGGRTILFSVSGVIDRSALPLQSPLYPYPDVVGDAVRRLIGIQTTEVKSYFLLANRVHELLIGVYAYVEDAQGSMNATIDKIKLMGTHSP